MTTVMEVDNLQVWLRDRHSGERLQIVRGLSFSLQAGERLGLVGESGCGKTTTVLAMMGLLPDAALVSGLVRLDGTNVLQGGEAGIRQHRWRDIAMVFQGSMSSLNPVRRIGWQLSEAAQRGEPLGQSARRQRVTDLLQRVGLRASTVDRFPHELSGGMKQRAAIAMALASRPKVLLADEPTTAVDAIVQAQILSLLRSLADEMGLAIVFVTHDLQAMRALCDRAVVMYAGEAVEAGPIGQLTQRPAHPYTRLLFAATADLHRRGAMASIPGSPPGPGEAITGCRFRSRCDSALPRCATVAPVIQAVHDGHDAACHLLQNADVAHLAES